MPDEITHLLAREGLTSRVVERVARRELVDNEMTTVLPPTGHPNRRGWRETEEDGYEQMPLYVITCPKCGETDEYIEAADTPILCTFCGEEFKRPYGSFPENPGRWRECDTLEVGDE
jgi:ribosomal protein S27E